MRVFCSQETLRARRTLAYCAVSRAPFPKMCWCLKNACMNEVHMTSPLDNHYHDHEKDHQHDTIMTLGPLRRETVGGRSTHHKVKSRTMNGAQRRDKKLVFRQTLLEDDLHHHHNTFQPIHRRTVPQFAPRCAAAAAADSEAVELQRSARRLVQTRASCDVVSSVDMTTTASPDLITLVRQEELCQNSAIAITIREKMITNKNQFIRKVSEKTFRAYAFFEALGPLQKKVTDSLSSGLISTLSFPFIISHLLVFPSPSLSVSQPRCL